ncbi:hypothetical protein [uncultured Roseobacter sp.]|uniref:hypothetical protein n=1 Tax=uncultured Roseobacter sp. TaxID=114847 RepID=UPI00261CB93C|nr:hypothetical protein [uncultured Roseobacter sp.]
MQEFMKYALAAGMLAATPAAAEIQTVEVRTHPSQGDVEVVEGGGSTLIRGPDGIHVSLSTSGLIAGHVYTYWMVVFNEPGQCEAEMCSGKDALVRTDIVESDAGYVGGAVVGADGTLSMTAYQPVGQLNNAFFDRGILETDDLEVHLILQDHGPVIAGRELEMLSTYRGGCSDDSIPPPFPVTARAQGEPGPNACRMVQVALFAPS